MRIILLTGVLLSLHLFIPLLSFSQNAVQSKGDSTIVLTAKELKELIGKEYYTRIPNSDLDSNLEYKISNEIRGRFNSAIALIGSILGLGGVIFGGFLAKGQKERFTNLSLQLKEEVKSETKEEVKSSMQAEVKIAYYEIIKKELDAIRQELATKTQKVDDLYNSFIGQLEEFRRRDLENKLTGIKDKIIQRVDLAESYNELINLLAKAEEFKDPRFISNVLNELSYASFYLEKGADLERIMSSYLERPDIDIRETALVNTALTTMRAYANTSDEAERDKTIKYLNRALKRVNDYGEALALKLELFMIEYEKEADAAQKQLIDNETQILLQQILRSEIASYEAIVRFERVQNSAAKSDYIDMVYNKFPKEMEAMKKIADEQKKA